MAWNFSSIEWNNFSIEWNFSSREWRGELGRLKPSRRLPPEGGTLTSSGALGAKTLQEKKQGAKVFLEFKESRNMQSTVTGKNQVTIPAALARRHRIEPGARLDWQETGQEGELRVRILPGPRETLRAVREIGQRYAAKAPDAARILAEMREEDDPPPKKRGGARRGRRV
jgi:bifunctional DNA-binding transcriptional regulator/antitoxin component of YhaV-PrlF toxin-antitoxin module